MVEVEDIEKSPLTSKVSNTLRLTKSEENLSTNPDSDSDSCCWAPEDEDISLQVRLQMPMKHVFDTYRVFRVRCKVF